MNSSLPPTVSLLVQMFDKTRCSKTRCSKTRRSTSSGDFCLWMLSSIMESPTWNVYGCSKMSTGQSKWSPMPQTVLVILDAVEGQWILENLYAVECQQTLENIYSVEGQWILENLYAVGSQCILENLSCHLWLAHSLLTKKVQPEKPHIAGLAMLQLENWKYGWTKKVHAVSLGLQNKKHITWIIQR